MRKATVMIWLSVLLAGISALFWYNDWVYRLPTPLPLDYKTVAVGSTIDLGSQVAKDNGKPVFLHFFNPRCPCSRFNIPHFTSLVNRYGHAVNFAIVVLSSKEYTEKEIQNKLHTDVPVLFDTAIAVTCGVYSTPQAVIIGANHQLYYRGNYNRTRYCDDKKTEYARLALDALLQHNPTIVFDQFALKAYGCKKPKCTK